ncbi:DNA-binding transcriptional regulator, LacI/PurR family [Bifidobacterium bohemicum]|uniref:LacI-type transcriptional regulator n=1 Tax=Bifidobacterium bohemicum DSM 22767 TaxID=1437606 RepID=A0A086ZF42_9BIFI|nr:LacI family DNA-binding transcriptional regulator [Bifidobacterium bohemicum]KFI45142.1 LacI-type transcriptional regulator [Bifidobacterium bohemicum DSM 22767]SCB90530.1 DNA-binding transcriptional regulator, LacI/PurR family [Bifidobacterium bohemicum]
MPRVTLHDVALEAGVSDSTVSRALRGLDKVDEGTRAKVKDAARELRFSFSRNASSLASGKTMRLALLFSDALNTWFDSSVLQGAYEVLSPAGYDIIPSTVSTDFELNSFLNRLPYDGNVDGVIVCSINLDTAQSKALKKLTIPVVGLDSRTIDGFDASVLMDDDTAMDDAVGLLQGLGHQRIAFVGWPAPGDFRFSSQLRAGAFMKAAKRLGFDDGSVARIDLGKMNDYRSPDDALSAAAARLLALDPRPTGICVEVDGFAVPLIAELKRFGVRVPEDMSVIGFDDTDVAAAVEMTTVHQNPVEMSRLAARKVLALMRGQTLDEAHSVLRPMLIPRKTTGPIL